MTTFKDNFSKQSQVYSLYRPTYPVELFEYLNSLTEQHQLAWDCGTGNGQSAISLARYYETVYATDPSDQQINNAMPHSNIIYKVEKAEQCGLNDSVADLVTIAQALHWFEFNTFYAEVKRVLKPNGIIAAWAYGVPSISPEIDSLVNYFHDHVVGEFWQRENKLIDKEYATIPFPFAPLTTPVFTIQKNMSFSGLMGLINSWSAVQRYIDIKGANPAVQFGQELTKQWGNTEDQKPATWKLILKLGQNI